MLILRSKPAFFSIQFSKAAKQFVKMNDKLQLWDLTSHKIIRFLEGFWDGLQRIELVSISSILNLKTLIINVEKFIHKFQQQYVQLSVKQVYQNYVSNKFDLNVNSLHNSHKTKFMQLGYKSILFQEPPQAIKPKFQPKQPNFQFITNAITASMQFSRVGRQLALLNDRLQLFNLPSHKLIRSHQASHNQHFKNELSYSPDSREIAYGDDRFELCIWSTMTGGYKNGHQNQQGSEGGTSQDPLYGSYRGFTLDYSPCGKYIIMANGDGGIQVWDTSTCTQIRQSNENHCAPLTCIRYSPNGKQMASGSVDGIQIFNAKTLKLELNIECRDRFQRVQFVNQIAFTLDNREIISTIDMDGEIKIWNADSGRSRIFRKDNSKRIAKFSMSNDDKYLLYSGRYQFGICDFQTGALLGESQQQSSIVAITYSRSQSLIALSCEDGVIRIYRRDS